MLPPVILNTTPLTNFALTDSSALIFRLWAGRASTTRQVMAEYQAGVAGGLLPEKAWGDLPIVTLTPQEQAYMQTLAAHLGAGERSCIAVCKQRSGLLVTDDLDARRVSRHMGIPITGSIGILAACVQAGHIPLAEGNLLLAGMMRAGFRSPVEVLDTLLP